LNNTSQEFGIFIDNIRSSRNMSRDDFVDGILSKRQFSRYLKGDSTITNDKIFHLIDKLEMSIFDVYKSFFNKTDHEHKLIETIYNHVLKSNFKEAYKIITNIEKEYLSSKYNLSFFQYCKITTYYNLKRISKTMAMDQYIKLIDYPKCLDYDDINFIELITLLSLSSYQLNEKSDKKIAYFLYDILKKNMIETDTEMNNKFPSLIVTTCQTLGTLGEYKKVLVVSQKGIDICLKSQILNSLPHLFYYKALSLLHLNKMGEALVEVKKVFMLLEIQNDTNTISTFEKLLQSHFRISLEELFIS